MPDAPWKRRPRLSRDTVVTRAIAFVDGNGLQALTMRRLSAELDVEAMSLYNHVAGREDLLDAMVHKVIDELYDNPGLRPETEQSWQSYLQHLAHGIRKIALAHPQLFPLVATRHPAAPWVRPPLRSLEWIESFLHALTSRGFDDAGAVDAYRSFTSFLLGHLLLEISGQGVDTGPSDEPLREPQPDDEPVDVPGIDLADYPLLTRMRTLLEQDQYRSEFEEALEQLLDRLELTTAPPPE